MGTYRDLNDYEIMYMVEEDDDAKELLFDKYRPIVLKMASKYRMEGKKIGLEVDDLIQEGYMGLVSAIKNYNPDDKTLFYTYALISIKSKIVNCLRSNSCKKHYCLNQSISLSKPVVSDRDLTLSDFIIDNNSVVPDSIVQERELTGLVKDYLYALDFDMAAIMELMINGFSSIDIARLLDLSNKNVSNNIFRIRKKLHNYLEFM